MSSNKKEKTNSNSVDSFDSVKDINSSAEGGGLQIPGLGEIEEQKLKDERSAFDSYKSRTIAALEQHKKKVKEAEENNRCNSDANEKKDGELKNKERSLDLRVANIDNEVKTRVANLEQSYKDTINDLKRSNGYLTEELKQARDQLNKYEQLELKLGDQPISMDVINDKLQQSDEIIAALRDELAIRPTKEKFDYYKDKAEDDDKLISQQQEDLKQLRGVDNENRAHARRIRELEKENEELSANNKKLQTDLNQYRNPSGNYVAIHRKNYECPEYDEDNPRIELKWLKGIHMKCLAHGFRFNMRILKAFHTSLKIAQISPLTVLAGVSGVGKSELPRLYSYFGGLIYKRIEVQPNWDSQESMLGYYNPIEGVFDAQPVFNLLMQSQKKYNDKVEEEYPGLNDALFLILLDEMNLAHPEQYFAGFLSALEERRGMSDDAPPKLDVKIGVNKTIDLPLGSNVLWAGTMNQDESTKSLSDKVLDRSVVIYFPKPQRLVSRDEIKIFDPPAKLLHKKDFDGWRVKKCSDSFAKELIEPYKQFTEKLNNILDVNHGFANRVWQSIEFYMANHPDVRAANGDPDKLRYPMHIAFEDQLAQKVMPRLRGIDTDGKSRTGVISKIRALLEQGIDDKQGSFKIIEDFDNACKYGNGQFMWTSSNYLSYDKKQKDENIEQPANKENVIPASNIPGETSDPVEEIPPNFMSSSAYSEEQRVRGWKNTPEKGQKKYWNKYHNDKEQE